MKTALVLLALLTAFLAPARAATLNELNGPLLNKGQWEFNALSNINYSANKDRQTAVDGTGSKADSNATQVTLSPGASYGLTEKLTLLVQESFIVPYTIAYKHYLLPGTPDAYYKSSILGRNMLSSSLTWRPSDPWQFLFSGSRSYIGSSRETGDLTGSGAVNTQDQQGYDSRLAAQATWLSTPKAGPITANNRADLDGLLNPLLDQGQAKAALGLNYFAGYAHANYELLRGPRSDLQSFRTTSGELSFSPSFSYGLLGNLQAQAVAELILPNATSSLSRSRYVVTNAGVSSYRSSTNKDRTLAGYYPSLSLTHRLNRQLQWYVSGNYSYSKSGQRGVNVNETTGVISPDSRVSGYESAAVGAGADWISAPRKEGRPLTADLDGLKKPLLERGQFWAAASYSTSKQRYWTAGAPTEPGDTSSVYYSELSYGVRDALQAFASVQIVPGYSQRSATFKSINPAAKTYGAGLTWRPRQTFQASAETSISPGVRKSVNYDGNGAVTSTARTDSTSCATSLNATWLW